MSNSSYSKIPAGGGEKRPGTEKKEFYNQIQTKQGKAKRLVSAIKKIHSVWLPFAEKVLGDPVIPAPDLSTDQLLTSIAPTFFAWPTGPLDRVSAGFNFLTETIDVYYSVDKKGNQAMTPEEAYQAVRAVFAPQAK